MSIDGLFMTISHLLQRLGRNQGIIQASEASWTLENKGDNGKVKLAKIKRMALE